MRTSQKTPETITTIGIDLGKNTGAHLQRKVSRSQLEHRLSNVPRSLIGMEACSGSHHIGRQLPALGHDERLIPAQYVKPFLKGHKNDYRDAEAIAEAVQRPDSAFTLLTQLLCSRIRLLRALHVRAERVVLNEFAARLDDVAHHAC
jgi:transposase